MLRGTSTAQSLLLVDGFRMSSASLAQPTYEALPFGLVDRMEVLRGPASGLYGADAIGGVIQLFTPTARQGLAYSGDVSFGSHGTRQLGAGISGGSGAITAGLQLTRDSSDGFNVRRADAFGFNADDDGYEREGVLAHVTAQYSANSSLRAVFMRTDLEADFDDGTFAGARVDTRSELAGLTNTTELPDQSVIVLKLGRSRDRSISNSSFASRFETTQDQIQATLTRPVAPGVEMQLSYERLKEEVDTVDYASADALTRKTNSYGASITGREGAHILQLSVRRDKSDQYDDQTNATFSYGYMLSSAMRVGGAYSTGYRAPGFNDLYYPGYGRAGIRPEESRNIEFGAYWDQVSKDNPSGWQGKAVLFANRIDDLIVYNSVCPDTDPQYAFGCADNVNEASINGLSLSLGRAMGGFAWRVNADFLDPTDDTLDKRLARRATRQLSARFSYALREFTFGSVVKVSGDRYDDAQNNVRLGGFVTADLSMNYALSKQAALTVSAVNVADRDYSTAGGYFSQPRTLMVGLRFNSL